MRDGCEDQEWEEEGALLELELPGLLILRLLQVLPHADVLIMLVLDLCLHRLQLGVELRGDRRRSEATQGGGEAPVTWPRALTLRARPPQAESRGRPRSESPSCPTANEGRLFNGPSCPSYPRACYLLPVR